MKDDKNKSYKDIIVNPFAKLIAFVVNVILSSIFCNILVLDSSIDNEFSLILLLKSRYLPWMIIYLILMGVYFFYAYKKEKQIMNDYVDMYTINGIIEKVEKEKYVNTGKVFNKFLDNASTIDEVKEILKSRDDIESGWNSGD